MTTDQLTYDVLQAIDDACHAIIVDLVRRVGRLVIVGIAER